MSFQDEVRGLGGPSLTKTLLRWLWARGIHPVKYRWWHWASYRVHPLKPGEKGVRTKWSLRRMNGT